MRDHIHTIPVLDALRNPDGCAFCVMKKKLENDCLQFILGPAYMEDDVRMETNKVGFCKNHMQAMYKEQNRLGLALMLHTHMQKLCKDTNVIIDGKLPAKLFNKDPGGVLPRLKAHLIKTKEDCYVCKRVNDTFERYVDTFFYLWSKGGEESKLIESQEGYCLPHYITLLSTAETRTNKDKFLDVLYKVWQKQVHTLEEDLDWFVQKFDHRNADAPWKNSKDAVPRTVTFLGGGLLDD